MDSVLKEHASRSVPRVEDDVLLRGHARFLDDIDLPDLLHAAFVRSREAHARIVSIDCGAARAMPGVLAVFDYADIRARTLQDRIPLGLPAGALRQIVDPFALVKDETCYVGEPLAVVIAQSRRLAEDAVSVVEVDYEPLPVVTDPVEGLVPGSPQARLECPNNLVAEAAIRYGAVEEAFAMAAATVKGRYRLAKGGGHSMECRGVVARFDAAEGLLTVWDSTQVPHKAKSVLVTSLGLSEDEVRVIAPDVGGGFGPKAVFHPEELVVPVAALLLGQPVKWVEDRVESFSATCQEREQDWDMEAAFARDGQLLGIRGRLCHDHGACTPYGIALPYNAGTNLIGPYALPAYDLQILQCLTNFVPATPTRGAGRPQGTFVMERLLDLGAEQLGLDRFEVRTRNLIRSDQMPYVIPVVQRDGAAMTYDCGDYLACQEKALASADVAAFKARQAALRVEGRWIGLGLCNYVEATGRGPYESASVRISPSGAISITTGATAQGQGIKTMLAQLAADGLGVAPDRVRVTAGDTIASPLGLGAFGSRQAVTAGNAVHLAAKDVARKVQIAAGEMLEASPDDIELADGLAFVRGVPGMHKTLGEIAKMLGGLPGYAIPGGLPPGLASSIDFEPKGLTYTNGTHVAEVEVDIQTGGVRITRYIVVHDCGTMINPTMVEGQVMGGVAHGIGATLLEWMRFDEGGQPKTANYADYTLPTSDSVGAIEIHHLETPTPLNPLGVKGAAESGTIGAPAAIVGAIEDALSPLGVRIMSLPMTPPRLHALIAEASKRLRMRPDTL